MKQKITGLVLSYIRFWARVSIAINKPTIIGIAGTAGKSSTRNALYAVLKDHVPVKYAYGNSETGLPLGILGIKVEGIGIIDWFLILLKSPFGILHLNGTKYLIAEMGIDEPDPPKNMEYLLTILKPHIAIYLNESAVHTMQFEKFLKNKEFKNDQEKLDYLVTKLAEEDVKIITKSDCRIAIYNADDNYVEEQIKNYKLKNTQQLVSFGSKDSVTLKYKSYDVSLNGTTFEFEIDNQTFVLHFNEFILPETFQENFAAVILVAREIGLTKEQIENSLTKNFTLPPGRSSIFQGINNTVILDSSYNASKAATRGFIELLKELKQKTKRPIIFVFGDMREIGSGENAEHEEIAKSISGVVDELYLIGKVTREIVLPIIERENSIKKVQWFESSQNLGKFLSDNLPGKSIVLVKGSQNTIFLEEAIKPILENKSDIKKLCRQEAYWMKIKERYFKKIS